MRAALELAAELPGRGRARRRGGWIAARLAEAAPGRATVVYHSVVMQYLPEAEREEFETASARRARGRPRSSRSPGCGWSRPETGPRCGSRPGPGRGPALALAGYHGTPVELS